MMKTLLTLAAAALVSANALVLAQDPPPTSPPPPAISEPLEADDAQPREPQPSSADAPVDVLQTTPESTQAAEWRREVMRWKDARRVEEGTSTGSISELNQSVLVLGTVDGDISTLAGDIAVLGDVTGDVSTVSGTVTVLGTIRGDASIVGGNLRVAGKVHGDASVVGGTLETAPGGVVAGDTNSVGKGSFKFAFNKTRHLHGNGGPDSSSFFHLFWLSPFMFMWRSALVIFWIALACAIAALFSPAILRAQSELRNEPARSVAFGFLWTILFWMLLVACVILSFVIIGIPLVIVLVAFHLALGAFGMTLTFSVVGDWLARRLNHPNASLYAAVFVGACFLGLIRLIPIVGSVVWFAAGLFGIGAALAARFGTAPPALPQPAAPPAAAPL